MTAFSIRILLAVHAGEVCCIFPWCPLMRYPIEVKHHVEVIAGSLQAAGL